MKSAIGLLVFTLLFAGCATVPLNYYDYEQNELIVIHEKVGETIDLSE
jgi:hypothetical protein